MQSRLVYATQALHYIVTMQDEEGEAIDLTDRVFSLAVTLARGNAEDAVAQDTRTALGTSCPLEISQETIADLFETYPNRSFELWIIEQFDTDADVIIRQPLEVRGAPMSAFAAPAGIGAPVTEVIRVPGPERTVIRLAGPRGPRGETGNALAPNPTFSGRVGLNGAASTGSTIAIGPNSLGIGTVSCVGGGSKDVIGTGTKFKSQFRRGSPIRIGDEERLVISVTSDTALRTQPFQAASVNAPFYLNTAFPRWQFLDNGVILGHRTSLLDTQSGVILNFNFAEDSTIIAEDGPARATHFNISPTLRSVGAGASNFSIFEIYHSLARDVAGNMAGAVMMVGLEPNSLNGGNWNRHGTPTLRPTIVKALLHSTSLTVHDFADVTLFQGVVDVLGGRFDKVFGYRMCRVYAEPNYNGSITNFVSLGNYQLEAPNHTNVSVLVASPTPDFVPPGKWFLYDDYGYDSFLKGRVGFNGAAPQGKAALPGPLATDGSASSADIATLVNAIRSALIAVGLAQ